MSTTVPIHRETPKACLTLVSLLFVLCLHAETPHKDMHIHQKMQRAGLVRVQDIAPGILVDLKYATKNNFMSEAMYGELKDAYLRPHMAKKLKRAQEILEERYNPNYKIIIYDAARPLSVQKKMYKKVQHTPLKVYVAPAHRGGRHNYGVAVDLSIWDTKNNRELEMGGHFDLFDTISHVGEEKQLLAQGKITKENLQNRQLLYTIMREVGLVPYRREWWHYEERESMSVVRKKYVLLDF